MQRLIPRAARWPQVESAFVQTESQLEAARGGLRQAQGALDQAQNELKKKRDLASRGAQLVSKIELERLENTVDSRSGGVDSAKGQYRLGCCAEGVGAAKSA